MLGVAEVSAAIGGLRNAYELAKGLHSLTTETAVKLQTMELMEAILAAQQSALSAQQSQADQKKRIHELEKTVAAFDRWETQKARYHLIDCPSGAQVYILKSEYAEEEIVHRLCPVCFQKGEKSILQTSNKHSGGEIVDCIPCKAQFRLSDFVHRQIRNDRGSSFYV